MEGTVSNWGTTHLGERAWIFTFVYICLYKLVKFMIYFHERQKEKNRSLANCGSSCFEEGGSPLSPWHVMHMLLLV